jgi:aspartate aminotransferase-like enzyme
MTYTQLKEFSVVYTDRSLNHMSDEFVDIMKDISKILKKAYNADSSVIVPGSGTFGMEAVARQFANNKQVLIIRNGWFSYRWTQIFDMGNITGTARVEVITGEQIEDSAQAAFVPPDINDVVDYIHNERPRVVFAPHVETSCGMILPDDYLEQIGQACRDVDALFVLDCIASGAAWVDMKQLNIDVVITAPQKGWSSAPCCALIAMSSRARQVLNATKSTSYSMDVLKWTQIMETYEQGKFIYHTTMPTNALRELRNTMLETESLGFEFLKNRQYDLGRRIRDILNTYGYPNVARVGYYAPGVIVCYTTDDSIQNATKFRELGYQTAAGVPLQLNERSDFKTFRIGLFGIDKLMNIDGTVDSLKQALEQIKEGK